MQTSLPFRPLTEHVGFHASETQDKFVEQCFQSQLARRPPARKKIALASLREKEEISDMGD